MQRFASFDNTWLHLWKKGTVKTVWTQWFSIAKKRPRLSHCLIRWLPLWRNIMLHYFISRLEWIKTLHNKHILFGFFNDNPRSSSHLLFLISKSEKYRSEKNIGQSYRRYKLIFCRPWRFVYELGTMEIILKNKIAIKI